MSASQAQVLRRLGRSLLASFLQAALLIGATLLLASLDPRLGMVFGVFSSALLMLRSFHREWPLSSFTCLLPAFCSAGCLLFQIGVLSPEAPPAQLGAVLLPAVIVGWLSVRGQEVFERRGQIFTRKSSLGLLIWVASVAFTQVAALFDLRALLGPSLVGGGFSMVMVTTMSVVLLRRYRRLRRTLPRPHLARGMASLVLVAMLWVSGGVVSARAETREGVYRGGLDEQKLAAARNHLRADNDQWRRLMGDPGTETTISATEALVQINPDGSAILQNEVEYRWTERGGYSAIARYLFSPGQRSGKCSRRVVTEGEEFAVFNEGAMETTLRVEADSDGSYLLWLANGHRRPITCEPIPWRIRFERPLAGNPGFLPPGRGWWGWTGPIDFSDPAVQTSMAAIILFLLVSAAMNVSAGLATQAPSLDEQATSAAAATEDTSTDGTVPAAATETTNPPQPDSPTPPNAAAEEATNLQNELNERRAWVDKLRRDIAGFRDTHQWETDYRERLQAMEADLAGETTTIAALDQRLAALGTTAEPAELRTYEYSTRYSGGDRGNVLHNLDASEDAVRRQAGVQYQTLTRIIDRLQRDDTLDLQQLREDGSALGTQLGHLVTEFLPSEGWVTSNQAGDREAFLRKLRSRMEELGSVDDSGRFYGARPDPNREAGTLDGRTVDIRPALDVMQKLVKSQSGETPVTYGSTDAWTDAIASVTNALSFGTGAEVAEALDRGGGVAEVGYAFGHGLLNAATAGGLSAADQAAEDYWSRGEHDGSVSDLLGAIAHAAGTGLARGAGNTILPVEAFGVMVGKDSTAGQRVGALLQVFGGAVSAGHFGVGLAEARAAGAVAGTGVLEPHPVLSRDAVAAGDPLRFMPTDATQRGTYVRNLLRDKGVRENLVRRVDYSPGPPAAGGKVKFGETFPGESPTAAVYDAAFREGRTSVESTAFHELEHVQQLDQRLVQAAPGGPLEGTMRGGRPTATGNRQMELEARMHELDRNLRTRNDALGQAGIDQHSVPPKEWPAEAQAAQREVQGARRSVAELLDQDRRVRAAAPRIEAENLGLEQQRSRIQSIRGEAASLRAQLELESPGSARAPQLSESLKARQAELEARQSALEAAEGRPSAAGLEKSESRVQIGVAFEGQVKRWQWDRGHPDRLVVDLDEVAQVSNQSGEASFRGGRMPLIDLALTDRQGNLKGFASVAASKQPGSYYIEKFKALIAEPFNETNHSVQNMLDFHGYREQPAKFVELSDLWVPEEHRAAVQQAVKALVEHDLKEGVGQIQSYADYLKGKGLSADEIVQHLVNKVHGKKV